MNYIVVYNIAWARFGLGMFFLFSINLLGFAQEESEKHRTYIGIEYINSETQRILTASLTARIKGERGRKKVADAEITFYFLSDTSEVLIGKAITNSEGISQVEVPQMPIIKVNEAGAYLFSANFRGNEEFKDISKEIAIQPVTLELSFIELDSLKNIVASAHRVDAGGKQIPVEEDVVFYVPRQFSKLKIGEVELEDGIGMIVFPVTLPGDSLGNLTIIASIEESREYGTVHVTASKNWGQVRANVVVEKRRGLGDTDAPLWMVYTLIILMSAVWFHYVYLMYVLFVIKKKGKMSV